MSVTGGISPCRGLATAGVREPGVSRSAEIAVVGPDNQLGQHLTARGRPRVSHGSLQLQYRTANAPVEFGTAPPNSLDTRQSIVVPTDENDTAELASEPRLRCRGRALDDLGG